MIPDAGGSFTFSNRFSFVNSVEKAYFAGNSLIRPVDSSVDHVDEKDFKSRQNDSWIVNDGKKIVV